MTEGDGVPGLAEKLNHLFLTIPAPTASGRYSNEAAAQALADKGVTVSGVHVSHLRSGRRDNPSARLLAALAELFDLPIGYFFDPTLEQAVNARLEELAAVKHYRGKQLMVRSHGLSTKGMELLEGFLELIRRAEGLDD